MFTFVSSTGIIILMVMWLDKMLGVSVQCVLKHPLSVPVLFQELCTLMSLSMNNCLQLKLNLAIPSTLKLGLVYTQESGHILCVM